MQLLFSQPIISKIMFCDLATLLSKIMFLSI